MNGIGKIKEIGEKICAKAKKNGLKKEKIFINLWMAKDTEKEAK